MTLTLALLAVLAAFAWTTVAGWSLARLFSTSLSREEGVGWSFAVGLVMHVSLYGLLLAARASPGPKKLVVGEAAILALSLTAKKRRLVRSCGSQRIPVMALFPLLIAVGAFGLSTLDVLGSPMGATDFLAIWGWKARTIFYSGSIPSRFFHDSFTFWSHPEYPFFVPLCIASFAAVLRQFDARALFLLYPAFEAATLLTLFGFLRRKVSAGAGSVGTLVAALCFPLYRTAFAGTAEVPMAFGFVLAATAALELAERDSWAVRARALVASSLCATTKQEGSLFVVLLAVWLAGRSLRSSTGPLGNRNPQAGQSASRSAWLWLILPLISQTVAVRLLRGPVARRDFDFTLLTLRRFPEWLGRWHEVLVHLARVEIPGAALSIVGIVLLLVLSRRRKEDVLLVILALQTGAYAAAASLSAFGPVWGIGTFPRITLTLLPVLALVLGARVGFLTPLEAGSWKAAR